MEQSIILKVADIVGSNICVSSEDGSKVYAKLISALETDRPIQLDFQGVEMLISAFLNASIGRLAEKHHIIQIKNRIEFTNTCDLDLIDRVLANASLFYADPQRFERSLEGMEGAEDEK